MTFAQGVLFNGQCHSRAGGNPAWNKSREAHNTCTVPLRGDYLINWIPACAGMTGLMDGLNIMEGQ